MIYKLCKAVLALNLVAYFRLSAGTLWQKLFKQMQRELLRDK